MPPPRELSEVYFHWKSARLCVRAVLRRPASPSAARLCNFMQILQRKNRFVLPCRVWGSALVGILIITWYSWIFWNHFIFKTFLPIDDLERKWGWKEKKIIMKREIRSRPGWDIMVMVWLDRINWARKRGLDEEGVRWGGMRRRRGRGGSCILWGESKVTGGGKEHC